MKRITFHDDARAELLEAAHYYEERVPGLGHSLTDDVELAVQEIQRNPHGHPHVSPELHRKVTKRFPYSLIYAIEPDRIRIIAVAHHKRRPEFWRYRLS